MLRSVLTVTCLLACVASMSAGASRTVEFAPAARSTQASPVQPKPLTNDDVVRMVKAGLPESTIVGAMQVSQTEFDVSPAALIALHDAGISQVLMDAMLAAVGRTSKRGGGAAPAAGTPPRNNLIPTAGGGTARPIAPVPAARPTVTLIQGERRDDIPIEQTLLAETTAKPTSMGALSKDKLLSQGIRIGVSTAVQQAGSTIGSSAGTVAGNVLGGLFSSSNKPKTLTFVWTLSGAESGTVTSDSPRFEVRIGKMFGVEPEDYAPALVQLTPSTAGWRLVGATEGKEGVGRRSLMDWPIYSAFVEDRIQADVQAVSPGVWQVATAKPLPPGEYALVLRPLSKDKKFAGQAVARNSGDGLLFNSAWSFSVK